VSKPKLLVALPDQQAPYLDWTLHGIVCDWLKANKPDLIACTGDLTDLPSISRYAPRRGYTADVNEVLDASQTVLREYGAAAPKSKRILIPGNHEQRWDDFIMRNCGDLAALDIFADTLPKALRLEALGYQWIAPALGPAWPHAMYTASNKLALMHGWIARKKSGVSALATLEHLGHSVIVGHTHRQAIVSHTFHESDGQLRVLRAVEAGTLAVPHGGLGYAAFPDWQPGFAGAWLWPDGTFNMWLATYVNGTLLYGNETYVAGDEAEFERGARARNAA
jgi:predicted phosphodiesterase